MTEKSREAGFQGPGRGRKDQAEVWTLDGQEAPWRALEAEESEPDLGRPVLDLRDDRDWSEFLTGERCRHVREQLQRVPIGFLQEEVGRRSSAGGSNTNRPSLCYMESVACCPGALEKSSLGARSGPGDQRRQRLPVPERHLSLYFKGKKPVRLSSGRTIVFDWVEVSLRPPAGQAPEEFVYRLKAFLKPYVTFDQYGRQRGYRHGVRGHGFGLSWVCSDPDCGGPVRSWPVHLVITGEGCDLLRAEGLDQGVFELLAWCIGQGAAWRASRVDLAYDGEDLPGPSFLHDQAGKLVSRSHHRKFQVEEFPGLKEWSEGTFYVGETGADRVLCVYDKRVELLQKAGLRPKQVIREAGKRKRRIRWELRLRKDLAQRALRDWFQGSGADTVFRANLEPLLRFQENPGERKSARVKWSPWWLTFLAGFGPATPVVIGAKAVCSVSVGVDRALRGMRPVVPMLLGRLRETNEVEVALDLFHAVLGFEEACKDKKLVSMERQERQERRFKKWSENYRSKFTVRRLLAMVGV